MKALTLQQPYAWAIFNGKDIENRKWKTKFRGAFLVHSAKTMYPNAPDTLMLDYLKAKARGDYGTELGGIIGSVELVDVVTESKSPWFFGPYGFILRHPNLMPFIPCKGMLNFWTYKGNI